MISAITSLASSPGSVATNELQVRFLSCVTLGEFHNIIKSLTDLLSPINSFSFKVYNSMIFSKFMGLCNIHKSLSLEHLCNLQRNVLLICSPLLFPFPIPDKHQATSYLYRIKLFWEFLRTSLNLFFVVCN